uniref:Uncharacterized protein n=1 Tax=Romanomermis culicivorax TaxID=13658 RepID=A0A915KTA7_ROMCU
MGHTYLTLRRSPDFFGGIR